MAFGTANSPTHTRLFEGNSSPYPAEQAASELGVSSWSLSRWLPATESRGALVPVELTQVEESTELSLVKPRGYRVEGLSEERLLRVVERLG